MDPIKFQEPIGKTAYILVGVPGSGKSTWVENQDWKTKCVYASTDYYLDRFAARYKISYNLSFKLYMKLAVKLMARRVERAVEKELPIIWDQTSVSIISRKKKFSMLPGYKMVAVYFETPERKELNKRLRQRKGKHIPPRVVDSMIENLEIPSTEEGFHEVWRAESVK